MTGMHGSINNVSNPAVIRNVLCAIFPTDIQQGRGGEIPNIQYVVNCHFSLSSQLAEGIRG